MFPFSAIASIFSSPAPAEKSAAAAPATMITIPVHTSNAVIPATVNDGLGILAVITTYLATSGIDVTSIAGTLTNGNFLGGLVATVVTLVIKRAIVTNSNAATIAGYVHVVAVAAAQAEAILKTVSVPAPVAETPKPRTA